MQGKNVIGSNVIDSDVIGLNGSLKVKKQMHFIRQLHNQTDTLSDLIFSKAVAWSS